MHPPDRALARVYILGAALIFSTGGMAIKATALGGWDVAGWRSAIAAVVVVVAIPRARRALSLRVVPVAITYALTLVLFTMATKNTTAANAIFLQYLAPLWIILFGPALLGESVRRGDAPYLIAMAVGMACIFTGNVAPQQTAPNPLVGNLCAVGSGVTMALNLMGLRWLGLRPSEAGDPGAAAVAMGNVVAVAMCLPFMGHPYAVTPVDWLWLVYLGAVQIALGYLLLIRATPAVPALELSLVLLLEPVLNPVWTAIVHGEKTGGMAVIGGGIVVGAIALRTLRESGPDLRAT